jgi:hypothetical protein
MQYRNDCARSGHQIRQRERLTDAHVKSAINPTKFPILHPSSFILHLSHCKRCFCLSRIMPGFTFDSPFRIVPGQDSQQVANRKKVKNKLPSSNKTPPPSFLTKAKRRTLSFIQYTPIASSQTTIQKQIPASPFPFLSLPLRVRQQVYGYVIGGNEKLHILRKHRPSKLPPAIGYRRCRAAISGKSCASGKCKEMSILDGVYCGWFDKGLSLLLTSRQMYTP